MSRGALRRRRPEGPRQRGGSGRGGLTPLAPRGRATWLLYGIFASSTFLLNGLGAVLAPLQRELGVTRGDVAFYPSLFAAGLLVLGVAGGPLVGRVGRGTALRLALAGLTAGGLLFAVPGRVPSLLGALLVGFGAALLIQLVPALLAALQPGAATAAVGEANGLASAASVLAPLAVGAGLAAGLGWRAGYLVLPLLALVVATVPAWRLALPAAGVSAEGERSGPAGSLLGPWFDLLLAVGAEFCMVYWAASALAEWHGAAPGLAPAIASLFLVGMALVRAFSASIVGLMTGGRTLLLACVGVAAAGFAVFWASPALAAAGAGLAVTGAGIALLYPATVSRAIAAWPHAPDRAAARAALASGMAIGGAPLVLGRLSDAVGLRAAYLIVPVLLVALAARTVAGAVSRRPGTPEGAAR